jgi:hypothetical protein
MSGSRVGCGRTRALSPRTWGKEQVTIVDILDYRILRAVAAYMPCLHMLPRLRTR